MAINIISGKESALTIYNTYKRCSTVPEVRQYYVRLRDAVIYELETYGFCELLDQLIENEEYIEVVAMAVVFDIYQGYKIGKYVDIEQKDFAINLPYVRCNKSKMRWIDVGTRMQIDRNLCIILEKIRTMIRDSHLQYVKQNFRQGKDSRNRKEQDLEGIIAQAKKDAEIIIENANYEAKQIKDAAQGEIDEELKKAREQANEDAKKRATELVARYIEKQQKQYKKEIDKEMEEVSRLYIENTKLADTRHKEMCDATLQFQGQFTSTFNDTINNLNTIKNEFYKHLHDWQTSLFYTKGDVVPLAQCYIEWYNLSNVDKILSQEVAFKNDFERLPDGIKDNVNSEEDIVSGETSIESTYVIGEESKPLDTTIQGLQKLNKKLEILLRKFEKALNELDLYVYYPEKGEKFDSQKHVLEDESDEGDSEQFITEYILPGIVKKMNDIYGDEIVIPALVRVKTEN